MSHLGAKPVKGGRPPKERRIRGISAVRAGLFVQVVASELMLRAFFVLKDRKRVVVIRRYVSKVISVSDGLNCEIKIIQPRWAIDE